MRVSIWKCYPKPPQVRSCKLAQKLLFLSVSVNVSKSKQLTFFDVEWSRDHGAERYIEPDKYNRQSR